MTSQEIRAKFLDFFKANGHEVVASAPMVMKNDPTLMFTNAGMNQFKNIFLGNGDSEFKRMANSQKCLRVSGKHNDLEEVGRDTYHHTFFEMLGNWSFGDYFKVEAIEMAWKLLTEVYGIPKDQLYVTIFEGDQSDSLGEDKDSYDAWSQWIDEDRIIRSEKKDNFWEMGEMGPCGPSSEIHIDLRGKDEKSKIPAVELINKDHPHVVEIWNLVFIEYNRREDGSLEKLPQRHVDTGMGLERLCMALNGLDSNYETDLFRPLIEKLEDLSGKSYHRSESQQDIAFRVIVDHIRAVSFAIAESQLPGNTGAGYVIRRILRRAIRYGYSFLNLKEPFLHILLPTLDLILGDHYPEIRKEQNFITNVIREEEENFLKTLETGIQKIERHQSKEIGGEFAFELYDTYGFPIDLTRLITQEKGWSLDKGGFQKCLQQQKDRSKAAGKITTGDWVVLAKDDEEEFIGYDRLSTEVSITKYREVQVKGEKKYQLVFNLTPFYPEGGGQVGDKGFVISNKEKIEIINTLKENELIVHVTEQLPTDPSLDFAAEVDREKRIDTARNHSATHLLHYALRKILGDHVAQKGSLVHPDYLRFDFSHFQKLSNEEIQKVESEVNRLIDEGVNLEESRNTPIKKAEEMGAMALFGEKYGDTVRVIKFGDSIELCGGTHVSNTGEIGRFKIRSESSVAAGVRRIEATTGRMTLNYFNEQAEIVEKIKSLLNNPKDPLKALRQVIDSEEKLRKEIESLKKDQGSVVKVGLEKEIQQEGGAKFLAKLVDLDPGGMKNIAFEFRKKYPNLFLVLATKNNGKPILTVMVGDSLIKDFNLNASEVIKELASHIGGSGGGQPFFATAGGKDTSGLNVALENAKEIFSNLEK